APVKRGGEGVELVEDELTVRERVGPSGGGRQLPGPLQRLRAEQLLNRELWRRPPFEFVGECPVTGVGDCGRVREPPADFHLKRRLLVLGQSARGPSEAAADLG